MRSCTWEKRPEKAWKRPWRPSNVIRTRAPAKFHIAIKFLPFVSSIGAVARQWDRFRRRQWPKKWPKIAILGVGRASTSGY